MPILHLLLALLIVVVWGINFIFIKFSLDEMSPLLLCTVRFFLASVPAIFFIKPPALPLRVLVLYGLVMFALQFAFLFLGMNVGMTPGVASLVMQVQVFFSMFFVAVFLGERPKASQIIGAFVSFSGIALIAMHFDENISLLGFICILSAAATWGIGNLIIKKNNNTNMLAIVVWGNFVACFPMLILSLIVDGVDSVLYSYHHMTWLGLSSLFYIAYVSTLIGYGGWNWLLSRHPVGVVVPFTLLVPVIGMLSSILILNESFYFWKLVAGMLMISGLCISVLSARFFVGKSLIEVT